MTTLDFIRICIAPAIFIVLFSLALRFPKKWIFRTILAFELTLTTILLIIEINVLKVAGTSGWMSFYALVLQFWIFVGLIIARIAIWFNQK